MPSLRLMLIALAQGAGLYLCGRLAGTSLPDAQRALLAAAHTVLVFDRPRITCANAPPHPAGCSACWLWRRCSSVR